MWDISVFAIIEIKTENLKNVLVHLKIEITSPLLGGILGFFFLMKNNLSKQFSEKSVIVFPLLQIS